MRIGRILKNLSYGVIIRDKVGNSGQLDDNSLKFKFAHKNSIYSQCFRLNSKGKACSFSLCNPMKHTFSFH